MSAVGIVTLGIGADTGTRLWFWPLGLGTPPSTPAACNTLTLGAESRAVTPECSAEPDYIDPADGVRGVITLGIGSEPETLLHFMTLGLGATYLLTACRVVTPIAESCTLTARCS
jgi:hypothetical protein